MGVSRGGGGWNFCCCCCCLFGGFCNFQSLFFLPFLRLQEFLLSQKAGAHHSSFPHHSTGNLPAQLNWNGSCGELCAALPRGEAAPCWCWRCPPEEFCSRGGSAVPRAPGSRRGAVGWRTRCSLGWAQMGRQQQRRRECEQYLGLQGEEGGGGSAETGNVTWGAKMGEICLNVGSLQALS